MIDSIGNSRKSDKRLVEQPRLPSPTRTVLILAHNLGAQVLRVFRDLSECLRREFGGAGREVVDLANTIVRVRVERHGDSVRLRALRIGLGSGLESARDVGACGHNQAGGSGSRTDNGRVGVCRMHGIFEVMGGTDLGKSVKASVQSYSQLRR